MNAYVALGSSLGERLSALRAATDELAALGPLFASRIYETRPVGSATRPFLNAAVRLTTEEFDPESLLDHMLAIERRLGRRRDLPGNDRVIDLDLVLVERGGTQVTLALPGLQLPHPRAPFRDFVLRPLLDLDRELLLLGRPVADWLAALPSADLTVLSVLDTQLLPG